MRRPGCAALALGLALVLGGCAAKGRGPDPRRLTLAPLSFSPPVVRQERLSGGAPVFLLANRDVPLVRVFLAFRGGSVYDPPDRAGLAQVLSLAWRTGGSGGLSPEALDDLLEGRGMDLSLSLGRDKGSAGLTVLTADLDQGLGVLAHLVWEPTFRPDRVEWAVGQVKEGIRREVDDPDTLAFRELRRALYRGHPRGVIATEETAGRAARDEVVALHQRLVTGGAWALGVVGDFDPDALLPILERLFGRLPGDGSEFPPLPAAPEPSPRTVLVPKALPQSTIVWARFGPPRLSSEFYPLDLADFLLGGGGFQSLLMREIRSDRGLAYSVGSFYDAYPEFGVLGVRASTKTNSTAEVVELLAVVREGAARRGFSPEEVAWGRESLENRYVFRYEDPASSVREQLGLVLDRLSPDLPAAYLPSLRAASSAQVSAAARRYFPRGPGVTVVVGDVDPEAEVWRGDAPVEVVRVP